jgi:dienelactone hydrolase
LSRDRQGDTFETASPDVVLHVAGVECSLVKVSIIGLLAVLSLLPSVLGACGGGDPPPVSGENVTYQATDGVRIAARWYLPAAEQKPAVVVLLHGLDGSGDQWKPIIPLLVDKGYAVLAPDLRGFGGSTTAVRDGQEVPYVLTDPDETILDVEAALTWLKGRSDVDFGRIGLIGARVGGNLAWVSTAVFRDVKMAIAISPLPDREGTPLRGNDIPNFLPHDVFFIAGGRAAWIDAVSLAIHVGGAVDGGPYADETLQGVDLLTQGDVRNDIIDWLAKHLA